MNDLTFDYNNNNERPDPKPEEPSAPASSQTEPISDKTSQSFSAPAIPLYAKLDQTQQATPKPVPTTPSTPFAPSADTTSHTQTTQGVSPTVPATTPYPGAFPYQAPYQSGGTSNTTTTPVTSNTYAAAPYTANPGYVNPPTANKYPAYSALSGHYTQPAKKKKEKKEKRRYGLGQMIAVALVSAMCCGVVSGVVVATQWPVSNPGVVAENTGNENSTVKTVNVSETSDSLVAAVAEKAAPSVVGVRVTSTNQSGFFGPSDSVGEGSGVVYTEDGYIITNYHVVSEAVSTSRDNPFNRGMNQSTIEVFLPSDSETGIAATIIGYDETADLAVLKIEKSGLTPIELGDSEALKIGDAAIAIGNPGGLEFMGSVSSGIISGLNRTLQTEGGIEMNLIQTDAAINPGNSGGALVNKEGKLIGINNSKMAGNGFEGMGFAIPANQVKEITDRLIKNEGQPQSYLGVSIDPSYDAETLEEMGYPAGVVVYSVAAGSPASEAGIQAYDIITKVNGTEISTYAQLNSEKNKYAVGDVITLTIYRENQSFDVRVTLGEMQGALQ